MTPSDGGGGINDVRSRQQSDTGGRRCPVGRSSVVKFQRQQARTRPIAFPPTVRHCQGSGGRRLHDARKVTENALMHSMRKVVDERETVATETDAFRLHLDSVELRRIEINSRWSTERDLFLPSPIAAT